MKTLLVRGEELKGLLMINEVIERVEEAFRLKALGKVQMPAKIYLFYSKYGGDLRCMPSYIEDLEVSTVKVVNSHPKNVEKGLRTVMSTVILVDPETGFPLAIMDGGHITDLRTGAAGGVAAKYLARKDSKVIGMIGAGRQARTQLAALTTIYGKLEAVRVYDISRERAQSFVEEMGKLYSGVANFKAVDSAEEAVKGADIVVTATPSRQPIVKDEWVGPGTHFNCIGADAPGKEELDPMILKRAKIVVDDMEQAIHSGEVNVPLSKGLLSEKDIHAEIGEVVAGLKPGRESESEITVFCSTGLAVQDAVTAKLAYEKAKEKGLGLYMELVLYR
ncbi:MAG: alanine dehydrogenase [Thermoprotei archaeon]|nr:MAG: alanine dehydrogenase [Thermoprotei archaeon]RLF14192.1 MAG: alanine dehydrogenase [Thermoprotei archaeon]